VFDEHLRIAGPATAHLDTGDNPPFHSAWAPRGPAKFALLRKYIFGVVDQGVLVPTSSAWSPPSFLVPKPGHNNRWRFVTDFRGLNKSTRKARADPPPIGTCTYALKGKRVRSQLDLRSAFWQLGLDEESIPKTATNIPGIGVFSYKGMPMGATNSMASLQAHLSRILAPYLFDSVIVWADDIIIFSETEAGHVELLRKIFGTPYKHGHTVNLAKSTFFTDQVDYLGVRVSGDTLKPIPKFVEGLRSMGVPTTTKEVQAALGFFNYLRKFAPKLADLSHDLQAAAKAGAMTDKARASFEASKQCLLTFCNDHEGLHIPDPNKELFIAVGAPAKALGAIAYQLANPDGSHTPPNMQPIGFLSRQLSKAEKAYAGILISGRSGFQSVLTEPLGILWALEELSDLVDYCHRTTLLTGHRNILFLRDRSKGMLFRWALRVAQFAAVNIKYTNGPPITIADALSRLAPPGEDNQDDDFEVSDPRKRIAPRALTPAPLPPTLSHPINTAETSLSSMEQLKTSGSGLKTPGSDNEAHGP
ncbi:MAG: reverse transcriptase family protein, partial [Bacteroidota bacterium]